MIRLLATYLRPYRAPLVLVMALLLVQALANLYLPELNADIINNGVAKGDTDYILQTGAVMLGVTIVLGIVSIIAVYWSAKVSMSFGRDVRGRDLPLGRVVLAGRGQPLRHGLADHPQHERRAAGPDGRPHGPDDDGLGADHDHRRADHGPPPGRPPDRDPPGDRADHGGHHRPPRPARPAALPGHAGEDRPHQPGDARDARRAFA